ncbi:4-hydroxy-tetrahydrodipicolinate reductase [Oxyplasma meridianum]|uniref:4-hydroxy-tetrahydrodipicolinate reductase n=1 Tax=Oxyplasma meridianum TaxID=3073602 RepID=A0AAX4NFD5_9ARCH
MNKIRICIAGATGWIGSALVPAVVKSVDMELVGSVARQSAGKNLGDLLKLNDLSILVSGSVKEALRTKTDVLIDYTSPNAVKSNVLTAIEMGVHTVIGTSGLTDDDYAEIDDAARRSGVGVFAAGNFAISAALMLHFATVAAKLMPSWEVVDYASESKIDSPSGTAYEIASRLSKVRKPEAVVPDSKVNGPVESRGFNANGTHIHSVRLPGYVIGSDVIFGGKDERLTLKFEAGTLPDTYIEGTLLATRKVKDMVGLTRGLDKLIL